FGITGTPVIDRSTNTLYVVSTVKEQPTDAGGPHYVIQFHALNLIDGKEKNGGPVTIGDTTLHPDGTFTNNTPVSVPGTGAGSAPSVASNGDLILSTGNGTFDAFTTTTPPGAAARGEGGFGLGFGGIHQSAAVSFAASIPSDGVSSTGLLFNGDDPTDQPLAPDAHPPLSG